MHWHAHCWPRRHALLPTPTPEGGGKQLVMSCAACQASVPARQVPQCASHPMYFRPFVFQPHPLCVCNGVPSSLYSQILPRLIHSPAAMCSCIVPNQSQHVECNVYPRESAGPHGLRDGDAKRGRVGRYTQASSTAWCGCLWLCCFNMHAWDSLDHCCAAGSLLLLFEDA